MLTSLSLEVRELVTKPGLIPRTSLSRRSKGCGGTVVFHTLATTLSPGRTTYGTRAGINNGDGLSPLRIP